MNKRKTLFYIAITFAILLALWDISKKHEISFTQTEPIYATTTKYGAFLAAQHAIYVNDFEYAHKMSEKFSDVPYEITQRTRYLSDFLGGNLPSDVEILAKEKDVASRLIYDAYLSKNEKWDDLYTRHKTDKSALYSPFRIWSAVAKNRITETIKYIDTIDSNPSWKAFVRGQVYAETGNIKSAAEEFAKVKPEFMNINDYTYILAFYTTNNMQDSAEKLHKEFTSNPGGMFISDYKNITNWKTFAGPRNALAFNLIQNVSHTKIMLFSDVSVLMLRFAQIIADESPWFNDAMNYYLGQFFINMGGDYEKYFNKMDKTTPLFSFAQMYSAEGTDSIEKLKDILDIQPLFVPAINRLVAKYTGLGDKKAALRIINNALKNENLPDLGRAYLVKRRALVHLLFNDLNRAQADIHEASKLTVTDSEILTIQARIWSAQKREIENAYDYAMTMVKRDPTDIMAWDTLAVVVAAREGNDAALDILERVGRSANTCSSLFEHLGDAYSNLGNKKMARDAYMRAIELSSDGLSVAPNIQKKLRRLK